MKKWIFAALVCGSFGCARQELGQPMQFAPNDSVKIEKEKEAAPDEAPADTESKVSKQDALEAGGATAPADSVAADELDEREAKAAPAPAKKRTAKGEGAISGSAAPCDAACKKTCANAEDKDVCAQAYAAGCFSGTAPATFDCGKNGMRRKAAADGVEEKGLPVSIP